MLRKKFPRKLTPIHALVTLRGHSSNEDGVGGVTFSEKKRYEGLRLNVISVTRGWVGGSNFHEKSTGYVTFELPLITLSLNGTPS